MERSWRVLTDMDGCCWVIFKLLGQWWSHHQRRWTCSVELSHATSVPWEWSKEKLSVESSLNWPKRDGQSIPRCINLPGQPLTLKARPTTGTFTTVEVDQVDHRWLGTEDEKVNEHFNRCKEVPKPLQPLYATAKKSCWGPAGSQRSAALLTHYRAIFSTGNGDVGQPTLVEHNILFGQRSYTNASAQERLNRTLQRFLEFSGCSGKEKGWQVAVLRRLPMAKCNDTARRLTPFKNWWEPDRLGL